LVRCGYGVLVVLIAPFLTGCGSLSTALLSQGGDGRQAGRSGSFTVDDGTDGNPNGATATEDPTGSSDGATGTDDGEPDTTDPSAENNPTANPADPPLIINTPGGQSVDPLLPDSPDTVDPIDSSVFDPLAATLGDPAMMGDLLPFLLDGFLVDMLGPAGTSPSGNADSFSYLELLCRDQGLPETYCRRRYAE